MTFTYNTITEANTFIESFKMVVACGASGGRMAKIISSKPGEYVVEVA
jgi:hypothetical protein